MPPCPAELPVTRVKRQSSSCSQYHSEESSMKLSNRSSHRRSSSLECCGFVGFFLVSMRLSPVQALLFRRSPKTSARAAGHARRDCGGGGGGGPPSFSARPAHTGA